MKQDQWTEQLRKRMKGYSEPVPEELWDRLERELNTSDEPEFVPWWKRWQAIAATVAVLLVSSLAVWFFRSYEENSRKTVMMEEARTVTSERVRPEKESSQPQEEVTAAREKAIDRLAAAFPDDEAVRRDAMRRDESRARGESWSASATDKDYPVAAGGSTDTIAANNREEETARRPAVKSAEGNRTYSFNRSKKTTAYSSHPRRSRGGSHWAIGISAANSSSSYSSVSDGYMRFSSGQKIPGGRQVDPVHIGSITGTEGELSPIGPAYSATSMIYANNLGTEKVYSNVKHKMPVSVGVSVRVELNRLWAIESGIFYTMLSSELQSGKETVYYEQEQRLHYIGIPLKFSRTIWKNRHFDVYASVGGAVEKCASGELKTTYVMGQEQHIKKKSDDIRISELQWSVDAAVGAQYKLTKELGIFAEPGIAYYFDDGSNVQTIRKEHPTNFRLQFGLRLNLGK